LIPSGFFKYRKISKYKVLYHEVRIILEKATSIVLSSSPQMTEAGDVYRSSMNNSASAAAAAPHH